MDILQKCKIDFKYEFIHNNNFETLVVLKFLSYVTNIACFK